MTSDSIRSYLSLADGMSRKRIRGHAILLGLVLWGFYAVTIATPGLRDRYGEMKGADFLHFYLLGDIARNHLGDILYNFPKQVELSAKLVPQSSGEIYLPVYGPQFSLLFIPFAALPYGWAAALWMLTSAAIYLICCFALMDACPHLPKDRVTILVLALAYPGFFSLIAGGQNAALALAAFTLAFFCFRANRPLLAGLALGLLAYKPQFGLMAALVFILTFEWKVMIGALLTTAGQLALGAWYYGPSILNDYAHSIFGIGRKAGFLEPNVYKMHSLRAFWQLLLPWPSIAFAAYAVCALAIVFLTIRCWRSKTPLPLRYAVFILGTVLVDPHLTDYDLVVLAPAFLFIGEWILSSPPSENRSAIKLLVYVAYALPLFAPLFQFTHVQFSVIAFTGLFLSFTVYRTNDMLSWGSEQQPIPNATIPLAGK